MASTSSCQHNESWYLVIDHDPADEPWPELLPYSGARYAFRPDRITVSLTRGGHVDTTISGLRLKASGQPGSVRSTWRYSRETPAWAVAEIKAARERHNVTEEALSR